MRRRDFLKAAVAGGAGVNLGGRLYPRAAWAQGPIKIGMPAALSGSNAQYGIQAKRAAELFAKDVKAKGILGRPVSSSTRTPAAIPPPLCGRPEAGREGRREVPHRRRALLRGACR